jgi:hypothetical protein
VMMPGRKREKKVGIEMNKIWAFVEAVACLENFLIISIFFCFLRENKSAKIFQTQKVSQNYFAIAALRNSLKIMDTVLKHCCCIRFRLVRKL